MLIDIRTAFILFTAYVLGIIIFFLIGSLIMHLVKGTIRKVSYRNISLDTMFWAIFTGIITVTSIYAIALTQFKTILLPVPLLLLFFHYKKYEKPIQSDTNNKKVCYPKSLAIFFLTSIVFYWTYYLMGFISLDENIVKYIEADSAFYGRAANYLNYSKSENISLDYLNISGTDVQPYHYGDLWLIAFFEKVLGVNSIIITIAVVYPLLLITFILGFLSYIKPLIYSYVNRIIFYGVIFFIPLIGGFSIMYPSFLVKADIISRSLTNAPKLFLVSCLLIATLKSLKGMSWNHVLILICLSGLLYINIAPPFILTIAIMLFIGIYVRKNIQVKKLFPGLFFSFISVVYGLLFYYYNSKTEGVLMNRDGAFEIKTSFNIFFGGGLQLSVLLPFLLVITFLYFKAKDPLIKKRLFNYDILFFFLLPVCSLFSYAVLYKHTNEAIQFFHNTFIPFSAMFITGTTLVAFASKNIKVIIINTLAFILSLIVNYQFVFNINSISKIDFVAAKSFIEKHSNGIFSNLRSNKEFNSLFAKNTVVGQPLPFYNYIINPYIDVSLNAPWIDIDSSYIYARIEAKLIKSAPLTQYKNLVYPNASKELVISSFIKDKRIAFLSVSRDTILPDAYRGMINDSIELRGSGWKIYAFKN